MPKSERNLEEREEVEKRKEKIKRTARITKFWLSGVIAFLSSILLVLIFRIGEAYWTLWLVEHRKLVNRRCIVATSCCFSSLSSHH